jgi:hypothetical protein
MITEKKGRSPQLIPICIRITFGPAKKRSISKKLNVEPGTTPKDAVSLVLPIMSGMSCCSSREVLSIGGVSTNPAKNLWWYCAVNGEGKRVSPHRTKLKAGDFVEWIYRKVVK